MRNYSDTIGCLDAYYYAHVEEIQGVPDPAYTAAQERLQLLAIAIGEGGGKCSQQSGNADESLTFCWAFHKNKNQQDARPTQQSVSQSVI